MARKNQTTAFDIDHWVRRTASRLRLIHSSFADQGFDQKRVYLEDEIEFALEDAGVSGEFDKLELLERLSGCFPVYSEATGMLVPAVTREAEAPRPAPPAGDPLQGFLAHLAGATPAQREAALRTLADHGYTLQAGPGAPDETAGLAAEITRHVNMPVRPEELEDLNRGLDQLAREITGLEGEKVDFNRLLKLLGMFAAALRDLHKFFWEFWRQNAPREMQAAWVSGFTDSFDRMVAAYLRGDEDCSSREFAIEIEKTKRLMLGVCVAVRKGAEEFARGQYQVFAPENIENAVMVEETAADRAKVRDLGRKAWEKYSQLSKHMTQASIDQEFQRAFSGVMMAWLRSRR